MTSVSTRLRSVNGSRETESVAIAVVTLILLEVPWFASVICVLLFVTLSAFGNALGARVFGGGLGFGTNFVVGCGCFVFLGQFLLALGIDYRFAHWLSLLTLLGGAVFMRFTGAVTTSRENDPAESSTSSALALGLAALSVQHLWLVPFATAVVAHVWFFGSQRRSTTYIVSGISMVIGWCTALQLRPEK